MGFEVGFLKDFTKQLANYKTLGDNTFAQLVDDDFFLPASPHSNCVTVIVQHLYGNMLSRFTNFLHEDGEKPWRDRDAEFELTYNSQQEVLQGWEEGWHCVFNTIATLTLEDLTKTVYIRSQPLLVYDALLRQLAHYSNHVGQILFIGEMIRDAQWQPLSIAKGGSKQYNQLLGHNK